MRPNPAVGAVLVQNHRIIGSGWHAGQVYHMLKSWPYAQVRLTKAQYLFMSHWNRAAITDEHHLVSMPLLKLALLKSIMAILTPTQWSLAEH